MKCNYLKIDRKILDICKNEYNYFTQKNNVVAIGLGYKTTRGINTCEKCIKVFVTKKVCLNNLSFNNIIPTMSFGIKTDIVETGIVRACSLTRRIRPVVAGYSVGPSGVKISGTMGCLVTDGKRLYILGNNHILANENTALLGTKIIQPALVDGGRTIQDTVATLFKYIPLEFKKGSITHKNEVDCAIAKVTNKSLVSPQIAFIGKLLGVSRASVYEDVKKVGRTTEETFGSVVATGATVEVQFNRGECLFTNQVITTKMTEKGDSGALLVDVDNYAVGMFFGASTTHSFFNPMDVVLDALKVKIVTG